MGKKGRHWAIKNTTIPVRKRKTWSRAQNLGIKKITSTLGNNRKKLTDAVS